MRTRSGKKAAAHRVMCTVDVRRAGGDAQFPSIDQLMANALTCLVVGLILFGLLVRLAPLATVTLVILLVGAFRARVVPLPAALRADVARLDGESSFTYAGCALAAVMHQPGDSTAIAACGPPPAGATGSTSSLIGP